MKNYDAFRGSKVLLVKAMLFLAVGQQFTVSQAYLLPPAYPGISFPILRYPGSNLGASLGLRPLRKEVQSHHLRHPPIETRTPPTTDFEEEDNNIDRKSRRSNQVYDSYQKFRPNRFPENSPEWNMAMIQYLLDMKKNGQKIREIETTKSLPELHKELTESGQNLALADQESNPDSVTKIDDQESEGETFDSSEDNNKEDPIICKMEPFNVCYRVDASGVMHPLGDRRPVRLLRVYKRK